MPVRVAETITGSASASSWSVAVDLTASCAKQTTGAKINNVASRIGERTRLACTFRRPAGKRVFGEPPSTTGQRPMLLRKIRTNHIGRFLITSFLQLRESDLFVPQRRGASPSSHSSFCEEVF